MKIFISTAMKQSGGARQVTLSIRNHLREEYGEDSVYLACHQYPSPTDCQEPRQAFEESERQIRQADAFVLFSPEGAASPGALVELGLALAWGKPVLALVPTTDALPYFLWRGTKTMTHLLADHPHGVPGFFGAGETYFRFIRAFIELRVLSLTADGPNPDGPTEPGPPLFGPEADPHSEYYVKRG